MSDHKTRQAIPVVDVPETDQVDRLLRLFDAISVTDGRVWLDARDSPLALYAARLWASAKALPAIVRDRSLVIHRADGETPMIFVSGAQS